ncbi:MAG: hypothetical protein ACOYK9_05670 [Chlamydiia bacterium]
MKTENPNLKMLKLLLDKGVKAPELTRYLEKNAESFFSYLNEAAKGDNVFMKLLSLEASSKLLEDLDDQLEKLAAEVNVPKELVLYILLTEEKKIPYAHRGALLAKKKGWPQGEQLVDFLVDMSTKKGKEKVAQRSKMKRSFKGKRV